MATSKTQRSDALLPTKSPKRVRFDKSVKDNDSGQSLPEQDMIQSLCTVSDIVSYLTRAMSDKLQVGLHKVQKFEECFFLSFVDLGVFF